MALRFLLRFSDFPRFLKKEQNGPFFAFSWPFQSFFTSTFQIAPKKTVVFDDDFFAPGLWGARVRGVPGCQCQCPLPFGARTIPAPAGCSYSLATRWLMCVPTRRLLLAAVCS